MQHACVSETRASPPNALDMIYFRRKPYDFLVVLNLVNLIMRPTRRSSQEQGIIGNLQCPSVKTLARNGSHLEMPAMIEAKHIGFL